MSVRDIVKDKVKTSFKISFSSDVVAKPCTYRTNVVIKHTRHGIVRETVVTEVKS